jgi:DNA-binding transcriptional LysR family regulator
MALDLAELRSLVAIGRYGSFTRAAEALGLSQPALSRRVSLAERTLGTALFERLPQGVRPTKAGSAFLRHAEAALTSLEDGKEAVRSLQRDERGELNIAFVNTLCDAKLVGVFSAFRKKHPKVGLSFRSTARSSDVSAWVLGEGVHLGLRFRAAPDRELTSRVVADETLVIVSAPTHPLAKRERIAPKELSTEHWIGYPGSSDGSNNAFSQSLALHGLESVRATAVDSYTSQIRLLEAGFGIGLLARRIVGEELRRGSLVELNVSARYSVPIALVSRNETRQSAPLRDFSAMVVKAYQHKRG